MTLVALLIAGFVSMPQTAPPPSGALADEGVRHEAMGPTPEQEEFARDELMESGLPSLADMAAEGREVAQISLNDPYYSRDVPAIQAQKVGPEATLSVFNRQGLVVTIPLTAEEWSRIHDRELTRSEPRVSDGPGEITHSWGAQVGWAGDGESIVHNACCMDPGMDIAEFAVRIALRNRPDCQRPDAAGFWMFYRFLSCFAPPAPSNGS